MEKYPSRELSQLIVTNLAKIADYFKINIKSDSRKYYGECPIHENSDNPQAFIMYKNSGIWICTTHHCENKFKKTSVGFVQALLSRHNKSHSEKDALNFISDLLSTEVTQLRSQPKKEIDKEKLNFIRQSRFYKKPLILNNRINFRNKATIPSEYYLDRGFSFETLDKYDVGVLNDVNHMFYNRTVVPIYDMGYNYIVGYTARSLYEKCLVCGRFHNLNAVCPNKTDVLFNSKWQHSKGFNKDYHLYNYWFARECTTNTLIIVEGPSHSWRLDEAGYCNNVAIFGSSLSKYQINLIRRSNINSIIIIGDNDEAGSNISQQIRSGLGREYEYRDLILDRNDIAEYSIEEIKEIIG